MEARSSPNTVQRFQSMLLIGFGLAVFYWLAESALHTFVFHYGSLLDELLPSDPHETWKRFLVCGLIIAFSLYAQFSINIRRRTEAALKERDSELSQIMEVNPAGIILIDEETRKISWLNSNALKMIGSSRANVEGHICHQHLCPTEKGNCPVLDRGQSIDISERILIMADGHPLPILKSVTRVNYNGRKHLLETFFDLSDRKKMETDLLRAHAELDQIFQTASVGMRLIDSDFNVLKINDTFAQLSGYAEEEAIGRKCHDVFGGAMCDMPECPLTRILSGTERVEGYVHKKNLDGVEIPCILTATPFLDAAGQTIGIVESFRDITDIRLAQDLLQSERDKLQRILSHLTEGVCIVTTDYCMDYQNRILKQQIGDSEGKRCYASIRQETSPCRPCLMETAIQTGRTQQHAFSLPDGRSFEQAYTPITDVDGRKKALVLLRDVTEERASSAAMMRAEQLAALGEMAAGVAHEINNPINGIINYAHVLRKKARAGSLTSSFAERIIKEGDRIASIVEGLLTFARRKKEGRTAVRVGDLVNDALTLSGAQLRKDAIHLETDIPENLPHVMAQPQEIEQVFINIISNARHALQAKYPESHRDKVLRISAEPVRFNRREYVRVSFLDRGSGIPAAIIDRVMNPFFTTKTEGKRTGLGLSISHGIMQDHDGRLTVQSRHGEYTRIDVDLPAQPEGTP